MWTAKARCGSELVVDADIPEGSSIVFSLRAANSIECRPGELMRNVAVAAVVLLALGTGCKTGGKKGRMDRNHKLVCDANNEGTMMPSRLVLTEKQAKEWGAAFEASGNCSAKLLNPELRSPSVALKIGGNSKLVIEGGVIEGKPNAIEIGGNAQLELQGTVVLGDIKKSGNAKVLGMDTVKKAEAVEDPQKK